MVAGLAEMLLPMRHRLVAANRPEPSQCGRVAVYGRDNQAVARQVARKPLDMAVCRPVAAGAGALRRSPARVQPVGRGDGKHTDIAAVFADDAGRRDGFGRHSALICDDHVAVRTGFAQPIGPVDGALPKRWPTVP